jgi:hypothetical protein
MSAWVINSSLTNKVDPEFFCAQRTSERRTRGMLRSSGVDAVLSHIDMVLHLRRMHNVFNRA